MDKNSELKSIVASVGAAKTIQAVRENEQLDSTNKEDLVRQVLRLELDDLTDKDGAALVDGLKALTELAHSAYGVPDGGTVAAADPAPVARDMRTEKAAGVSFEEISTALREALQNAYPPTETESWRAWVMEVYMESFIFEADGALFESSYTYADGVAAMTGDPVAVRRVYVPIESAAGEPEGESAGGETTEGDAAKGEDAGTKEEDAEKAKSSGDDEAEKAAGVFKGANSRLMGKEDGAGWEWAAGDFNARKPKPAAVTSEKA